MLTNLNLSDMESWYKAFRREVVQSFVIEGDRFRFDPEITAKVARDGWRILEMGVSYAGRTYAEGKKGGWKGGLRAIYCTVNSSGLGRRRRRHRHQPSEAPVAFADADVELQATLHSLDGATEYAEWIYGLVAPHIGKEVLEIGAGHGPFTERLAATSHVTATDVSERCVTALRQRFAGDDRVAVRHADLVQAASGGPYDSIVLINVLEHIEDDASAAKQLGVALRPDGRLLLWVPALPQLYSDFDRRIGHYRRYTVAELREVLSTAGLDVLDIRYVNVFGTLAWWLLAKKLRRVPTTSGLVTLFDRAFVPVLRRMERGRRAPFGQSIFCVAVRSTG